LQRLILTRYESVNLQFFIGARGSSAAGDRRRIAKASCATDVRSI
jgi:hypothetical protein